MRRNALVTSPLACMSVFELFSIYAGPGGSKPGSCTHPVFVVSMSNANARTRYGWGLLMRFADPHGLNFPK